MAKRGMNERIQKLRELSVTTPVHIDLERAKIETDFYKENDGKRRENLCGRPPGNGRLCDYKRAETAGI